MHMKRYGIIFLVLLILIASAAFIVFRPGSKSIMINTSKTTVIKQIQSLNRLETASYTIEKVIDAGTSGGKFQELLFGDRVLLIAHGEVIAGFDFAKVTEDNLVINGKTITLTLPAPEILVTRLDNEQTRVYDRRQGLLSKGDKDLESEARQAAESTIRAAACNGNILNEASQNVRKQLTILLKSLGYETVIINTPQGNC
jgi:hypothetical protein